MDRRHTRLAMVRRGVGVTSGVKVTNAAAVPTGSNTTNRTAKLYNSRSTIVHPDTRNTLEP